MTATEILKLLSQLSATSVLAVFSYLVWQELKHMRVELAKDRKDADEVAKADRDAYLEAIKEATAISARIDERTRRIQRATGGAWTPAEGVPVELPTETSQPTRRGKK